MWCTAAQAMIATSFIDGQRMVEPPGRMCFATRRPGGYQGLPALFVDGNQTLHWLTSATVFSISGADVLYHAGVERWYLATWRSCHAS